MSAIEVFSEQIYFLTTLAGFIIFFCSCIYSTRQQENLFTPLWLIFIGMLLDFVANRAAFLAVSAYSSGTSFGIYIFAELLFYLLSMLALLLSTIKFLSGGTAMSYIVCGIGGLGLITISLVIFLLPDGQFVNNMRQVFPIAGFISISLGLWLQLNKKYNSGYLLAALIFTVIFMWLFLRMVLPSFSSIETWWFVPLVVYILLSFSFIMMRIDNLSEQNDKYISEIEKYNNKIEDIIKLSPFPIIISRLGDDKIIMANNNASKMFGINLRELDRYKFKDFFADSDNRRILNERLESEHSIQDFEVLIKTPYSETPFWLLTSANILDYNYEVVLYSAFQDITSRKNREILLKNQAYRDPLTALYNRRYFEEEVAKQLTECKLQKVPYSVLMIDADKFKNINDTYGHKIGDKVLIELASVTERALRDNDIVARYGGEEFVVFLPGVSSEQGIAVAERLRQSISKIVVYSDAGQPVSFTVSIGLSSSEISEDVDTLIKTADEALYRAKQNGRNRVERFSKQDLNNFNEASPTVHNDETVNHHPVFDKDNNSEISLLDGVETSQIPDGIFDKKNKE